MLRVKKYIKNRRVENSIKGIARVDNYLNRLKYNIAKLSSENTILYDLFINNAN